MNTEPEALRLAYWLERDGADCQMHLDAAAELRRLYKLNQELLEALKLADALLSGANMNVKVVEQKVREAIEKAEAI